MTDVKGYEDIGADQVLSVEEGIQHKQRIVQATQPQQGARAVAQWHWMGNYGSVYDVVAVANSTGCKGGELITAYNNGIHPTWMFFSA